MVMLVIASSVVVGAAYVFHNQDMGHYRDRIQQLMLDRTGRDLQIRGDIKAILFPGIGLSLRDVWVANAAGFEADSFAEIEHARVRLDWLPLLGGDISIKSLELRGAHLNLQRDEEGRSNWDDLMQQTSLVEARSDENVLQEIEAAAPVAGLLSVGELVIAGGQINWNDRQNARQAQLQNLALQSGSVSLLRPFDLAVQFDAVPSSGEFTTSLSAHAEVELDLQQNRFHLDLAKLDTTTNMADRPTSHLSSSLAGKMVADMAEQTLELDSLVGTLADMPFRGELYIAQVLTAPALFGELQADGIDGANLLVDLGVRMPRGFDGNLLRDASIDTRLQYSAGEFSLSGLVFESGGITLRGELLASNLATSPIYSASVRSERFDARPWAAALGLQLPQDPELFQNVQIQSDIRQSGQLLALNQLQIQIDDTVVSGHIETADILSSVQPITFELNIGEIDLDRYRDLAMIQHRTDDTERSPADPLAGLIGELSSLDIRGQVGFDRIKVGGVELANVKVPLVLQEDLFEVREAIGGLYSGSVFATLTLDASVDPPRSSATMNLNGFELGPLLQDFYHGDEALLSGTGNINIDLHGRGANLPELIDGAHGALSARLTNGTLYFVDVADELRRARSRLLDTPEPEIDQESQTTYTELNLSAVFENQLLRSEDLSVTTPLMRITGLGEFDVLTAALDLALTGTLTTGTGEGNDDLVILNGLQLPLRLRGDIASLHDNFSGLSKSELRASLQEALSQRRDELQQQNQELQDKLEQKRETELESELQRERDSVESKMVSEVPTAAEEQSTSAEDDFMRALEDGKARFGSQMSEETRRELSKLLDE
jgi:AsmA protein